MGLSGIPWILLGIYRRLDGQMSNLSGKPTFIEPLTSIICLNLTLFMQYGLVELMPARAVFLTGALHFGSKIEIEAVASQFLNN